MLIFARIIKDKFSLKIFSKICETKMYLLDSYNNEFQSLPIYVTNLVAISSVWDLQIFFHKRKIPSFFFKSDETRERKSESALRIEPSHDVYPVGGTFHLHNACRKVAEKEWRKTTCTERNSCRKLEISLLMEKESSTAVLLVYYSTDYANNPAVSWIISFEILETQHRDARENIRFDISVGIVKAGIFVLAE